MTTEHPIAIIGAGLGGLTLASVLTTKKIPFVVFERDASADARGPNTGGSLDMHADSGTLALKLAGLQDAFDELARAEDDRMQIWEPSGKVLLQDLGPPPDEEQDESTKRPEIDRGQLRDLLLNSIAPDAIRWGKKFTGLRSAQAEVKRQAVSTPLFFVDFEDGASFLTPLVVGADGAWSRVRPNLSEASPSYTGITMVEGHIRSIDSRHPKLAKLIDRGSMMILGDNKGILPQRNGNSSVRIYVTLRVPEDWHITSKLPFQSDPATAAREMLARHFPISEGWSEPVRDLVLASTTGGSESDPAVFNARPILQLPIGHSWENRPGMTLVGDSAHLMSPFAGAGANLAMLDGARLALAIAGSSLFEENGPSLTSAVAAYEKEMQQRGGVEAEEADRNSRIFISEGGAAAAMRGIEEFFMPPPS